MGMNRRNALIGMGTIAAGGGALLATGAFSQVEAQRNVNVQFADDASSAYLGFDDTVSSYATTEQGSSGANVLRLQFDSLNDNARTTFDGVFNLVNNHPDGSDISVSIDTSNSANEVAGTEVEMEVSGTSLTSSSVTVSDGTPEAVDVIIDSTTSDPSGELTAVFLAR